MLSIDNVSVLFGGEPLFEDIAFLINERDRIGLVGKNGAGKTTLLRIICGEMNPTSGGVSKNGDCTIGYLPQTMRIVDDTSLLEECYKAFDEIADLEKTIALVTQEIAERTDYESDEYEKLLHTLHDSTDRYHLLDGDNRSAAIEKTIIGLGFRKEDFEKPTSTFSGGWRMRIELAKLLLRRPSLFLLDEPTNHLDIESIQWLEEYLSAYPGAVVLISHDRAFLDNVTTRTVELTLGRAVDYKVSYSKYVELRRERRQQQIAAYENQQKLIEKTEDFIERFRYKATKSNQVQSRIKQLEKLDRLEIEDEDVAALNIRFPDAPRSGQIVLEAKDLGHTFPGKKVFSGFDITIEKGQKIALVGRNGEGKTTFVRQIMGELIPTEGFVKLGHNVQVGYFAQNQDDLMDGEFTVFDTLDRVAVGDIRTKLRDILAAFLFRGEDIDKRVKVLSGGERSRLAMARLMLEPYNLLILDEPTNHLDMRSKEILKQALTKFNGTVIVISHDREFLDGLVDTVYEFRDGRVRQHLGGIYDFLQKRKLENLREIEIKEVVQSQKPIQKKEATEGYAERKQREKEETRKRNALKKLEEEIADLEGKLTRLESTLHDPTTYTMALFDEYMQLKQLLDKKMESYFELS